jgi:MFS family permease
MQMVASGWLVYDLTNSPLALGGMMAITAVPILIFSPFGGVVTDRVSKRNLLITTQGAIGLITLIITILIATHQIQYWHILASSLVTGAIFSFNMPGRQALVVELVGDEALMNAIALQSGGMNLTRIIAPSIAGVLMGFIGIAGVYFITVALYVASVLALFMISLTGTTELKIARTISEDFFEGVNFIRHSPTLLMLLIMGVVPMLFAMPYTILMPIFARDIWHVGELGLGVLMAVPGVGGLIGSLTVASLGNFERKGWLLLICAIANGLALGLFGLAPSLNLSSPSLTIMSVVFPASFIIALFILIVVGSAQVGYQAVNNTLIQTNITDEIRGRIMSVYMMAFGLMPLGVLPASYIANVWGAPVAVGSGGLLLALFALGMGIFQPRFRRLT